MQARKMIIAVLLGGPLLGTLMGIAADPTMVPPPEPHWRKARPDPIFTARAPAPAYSYPSGPIELSGNWYDDHLPTWKRRALEREIAEQARFEEAAYGPFPQPEVLPEPRAIPEPAPAPPPGFPAKVVTWAATPLDAAADTRAVAERDAETGSSAGAQSEPRPALVLPDVAAEAPSL